MPRRFSSLALATFLGLLPGVAPAQQQQAPPLAFLLTTSVDVQDDSSFDLGGDGFISPCGQPSGQKNDPDLHGGIFFADKSTTANSAVFTVRTASFIAGRHVLNWYSTFTVYALGPPGTKVHLDYDLEGRANTTNVSVGLSKADSIAGASTDYVHSGDSKSSVKGESGSYEGTTTLPTQNCYGQQYSYLPGPGGVGDYGNLATFAYVGGPYSGVGSADAIAIATISGNIVRPNQQPPVAIISAPETGRVNVPVTLDGSQSYSPNPDGSIVEYRWAIERPGATDTVLGPTITYTWPQPGSYLISLTVTDSDGLTGTTSQTITIGDLGQTVFLVHGIAQNGGEGGNMAALAASLRAPDVGLDQSRFQVDAGFDFGVCANRIGCDQSLCTIQNGAKLLALYVRQKNPTGSIVLVGYSMGGLIARDMILNNYYNVIGDHHVSALITLGTPHLGYPYEPDDGLARCNNLAGQMFGDFRNDADHAPPLPAVASPAHDFTDGDDNSVALSDYLYDLNTRWLAGGFDGPDNWLAAAGSSCPTVERHVPANHRGCPDNTRSDGVVCDNSAGIIINNGPSQWWLNTYSHTKNPFQIVVFCTGQPPTLEEPPTNGDLVATIVALINGLPPIPQSRSRLSHPFAKQSVDLK